MDIMIDLARLRDARDGLAASVEAFEDASSSNDDLEEAVSNPHGEGRLRDRVGWFEANWASNREDLMGRLEGIHEHLVGIIDGWDEWEAEASAALEVG